jgi:signal peptidase II
MSKKTTFLPYALLIFAVLLFDQILKIWIKTHLTLGQEITVFDDWFILQFTENNGMAFGIEFLGKAGKLILSIFRIVAVGLLFYYLFYLIRKRASKIILFCFSLIIAGAIGNILDSAFYGLVFSESTIYQTAILFPEGGGYASFLYGKVVDMLYFPLINISQQNAPSWIPDFVFGSDGHLVFFRPIFNIADASITVGVALLIVFYKKLKKG